MVQLLDWLVEGLIEECVATQDLQLSLVNLRISARRVKLLSTVEQFIELFIEQTLFVSLR